MKHPGKIVIIDNKVKFEYYELREPVWDDFCEEYGNGHDTTIFYQMALKEHEASKRVINVSNVVEKYTDCKFENENKVEYFEDGQSCEAEVENNVAVITQIL